MKPTRIITALFTALLFMSSCTDSTKVNIHRDFETRRAGLSATGLFDIFDTPLSDEEREAMEFLYAYMPLPDMTDYSDTFYLDNVRASLLARREMPWGASVPEREFRHFVLPVRVNNESLDSSRVVFYRELKDRVGGMSMSDAILEINHWCHEKVTYRPSDSRTSSPLASVRTAWGRCGEESTFTVAALRAMGIPARQVYTPRWAHTDDNHAWVEAWADGRWHFLGACEPEAILDLGWFNAPASRGMMMNTSVMGAYDGPEEQLGRNNCYTEINVTSNYAPVTTSTVTVVDRDSITVPGASVEFKVYNYAEFYTIARKISDSSGRATLTTGLGDMLVWVSHDGTFGFGKITATASGGSATVILDKSAGTTGTWEFDMVPPAQSASLPQPTPEQAALNNRRLALEDSIRHAYTSTFMNPETGLKLAHDIGFNGDDAARAAGYLVTSEGNHREIAAFLTAHADDPVALDLLGAISDKDLKDVTMTVLEDRINMPRLANPLFTDYILNPRVSSETLTPWRRFFSLAIPADDYFRFVTDPQQWVRWCADSITVDTSWNPRRLAMSPEAVYRTRLTDAASRDIFFVAGARSMSIPARIDPVTSKPQYADASGRWIDVDFGNTAVTENAPAGKLILEYSPDGGRLTDPAYYYHFTLSRIVDGKPVLLNFPDDSPLSKTFAPDVTLDAGQYLMTTGQRLADGTVLARISIFDVNADETVTHPLVMRRDDSRVQVIGNFNSENLYHDINTGTDKSLLSTTGRGYYILGILAPNHEPSTHALNDLSQYTDILGGMDEQIILLFTDADAASRFDSSRFPGLPATVTFGTDIDGNIMQEITDNMKLTGRELPLFIVADTFNRVLFVTQGYNIGLGEQLVDILHKIH